MCAKPKNINCAFKFVLAPLALRFDLVKGFFCLIICACSSNAVYVPVDRKEEGKFVKCSLRIKSARPEFLISRHVAQVRQQGKVGLSALCGHY